jgi:hypothetical protein
MAEAKDHMVFHRSLTDLSNEVAGLIEHLVIPQIVTACWDRGLDVDVLHADIDSGGYDLVLEAAPSTGKGIFTIRHIQFKASYRSARPRAAHMNIERRRGGCIVWIIWDRQPDGLTEVHRILFYGASPSKPMPPIKGDYVRRPGRQGRRRATKKMTSTQFDDVADFPELARKLFP